MFRQNIEAKAGWGKINLKSNISKYYHHSSAGAKKLKIFEISEKVIGP